MDLPESSNFFCLLQTPLSRAEVADRYRRHGWQLRKSSWTDYEVALPWATLVIESEKPTLVHGTVVNVLSHLDELLAPLRASEIAFKVECYGTDGALLQECTS